MRREHKIKLRSIPKPPTEAERLRAAVDELIDIRKDAEKLVGTLVGQYIPQKDKNGDLLPLQCSGSTGMCWCEYNKNIKAFRLHQRVSCPNKPN
jgi:hypothetical protein